MWRPTTPMCGGGGRRRRSSWPTCSGGMTPSVASHHCWSARGRRSPASRPPFRTELGQKHAAPFIEDAITALADADELVGLVLAPHYSRLSIGEYEDRLTAAAGRKPVHMIKSWHLEPALIELLAEGWAEARARF